MVSFSKGNCKACLIIKIMSLATKNKHTMLLFLFLFYSPSSSSSECGRNLGKYVRRWPTQKALWEFWAARRQSEDDQISIKMSCRNQHRFVFVNSGLEYCLIPKLCLALVSIISMLLLLFLWQNSLWVNKFRDFSWCLNQQSSSK